jgi:hypothetical protein
MNMGAVGGVRTDRENRSFRRKSDPVLFFPPQIPHDLTWDRARVVEMGNQLMSYGTAKFVAGEW